MSSHPHRSTTVNHRASSSSSARSAPPLSPPPPPKKSKSLTPSIFDDTPELKSPRGNFKGSPTSTMSMIDEDLVGSHQKEPIDAGSGGGGSVGLRATNLSRKKAQPPQPAKKLVIKLVKGKPTLPPNFEENTWATLKSAINAIFLKQPDPCDLEKLYQAVNDLCLHKMGGSLYQQIESTCEAHISVALQSLVGQNGDLVVFLSHVEKCWQSFCDQMLMIRGIALYLDRTYVKQTPNVRSLWDMGLQLFRKHLSLASEVEHKTVFGLLQMIESERLGETVDRTLLNHLLKMFTALGIYSESFEKPFLERTSEFYAAESAKYMQQSDVPDYLKHVETRLHEEHERCLLYLDACTRKPLVATAETQLLERHIPAILDKGFNFLMAGNRVSDLQRMYLLFSKVDALESLRQALSSYIRRTGKVIVMDEEKDKDMVSGLLDFKASLDIIWEESFFKNEAFSITVKDAFEHLINIRQNADIACPHSTTEAPAIPVSQSPEDGFAPAVISFPNVLDSSGSTSILSKKGHDIACPESSPVQDPLASCPESPINEDPLTGGHPIVPVSEGSSLMHDGTTEIKQVESYPCMESLDTSDVASYGPRTGKFQPKPKIHEVRPKGCTPNPIVGQFGVCENEHLDLSEFQNTISECHEDVVLDLSSLGFDNSVPLEPAFQLLAQDISQEQPVQHEGDTEAVCDMHERVVSRKAKDNPPSTSTSSQLLRPRRKCNSGRKLVDESEGEEPNEISVDPGEPAVHDDDDKELQVENKTQEKKPRKRSNKPVVDKEKPVRKRKKAGEAVNQDTGTNKKDGEATNQDTGTKSKKFPHSTRQRKRRVDQTLLETPEDEIEYQKVPLRDLIILADYKERMTKKTATSQVPSTGQSMGSTSSHNNDYEGIPSENAEVPMETLFNYHTYMEKTPRVKWLKQDTELFYQGIQQFGTDLSMIQQLFPGRTRNQIKLKYKKEERQHPLMLREALTNRPNDFSHFQHVIENLKKVAAENQQSDSKDESVDLADDEDAEPISETIDESTNSEQQMEQGEGEDLPAEVPVKSPPVSYESEEDCDFDWSQYKSDI